jgi:RES domain-containing protein
VTPLPGRLGSDTVVAWRLDAAIYASEWQSGEGAFRVGGRWNSKGKRTVYCSLDPATAILEVAVHKGFRALSLVPHVMTSFVIPASLAVKIIAPDDLPSSNWLRPGLPSSEQQQFGDQLLRDFDIAAIPSAVVQQSWNVICQSATLFGHQLEYDQQEFRLDSRLAAPAK